MSTIEVHKNSITSLHTDAIVNAANTHLVTGSGVCGAIFEAAGVAQLTQACQAIGHCSVGSAVITPSFNLLKTNGIKYIIHAVGPDYKKNIDDPDGHLVNCYKAALQLAKQNNCHSIGFPLISSGSYGCGIEKAWHIALSVCDEWIEETPDWDIRIIFVCNSKEKADYGKSLLQSMLDEKDLDQGQMFEVDISSIDPDIITPYTDNADLSLPSLDPNDYSGMPEELQELLSALDDSEYPETCACIRNALDQIEEYNEENVFALMSSLSECDATEPLAEETAHLVRALLLRMIDNGHVPAALCLGSLYYTGRIGEQDFAKAVQYYRIAADGGEPVAVENLGYCYYYGRSVPVDYEKAYHYFVKGALSGMVISLYKIGDMYRYGYYVPKDEKTAYRIYEHCNESITNSNVRQCGADVSMRIADCLFEGIGCEKDILQAMHYYQQAERLYYDRLHCGEYMFKNSLKHVLLAQQQCRIQILADLPDFEWTKEM